MSGRSCSVKTWDVRIALCLLAGLASAETRSSPTLISAAREGNTAAINALLSKGADPNAVDVDGTTSLHWSVRRGDLEATKALISRGGNVRAQDRHGTTPLQLACVNGDAASIEALLDAGAGVESANPQGETPLMTAARTGVVAALEVLLSRGASVNAKENVRGQTALMWAVAENQQAAARLLIQHGADVNARSKVFVPAPVAAQRVGQAAGAGIIRQKAPSAPQGAMSPLLYAVRDDNREMVELLLASGAILDQTDANGTTPLLLALINGHVDLADYLIKKGANVNAADGYGRTPLFSAIDSRNAGFYSNPYAGVNHIGYMEVIEALLKRGANPNAQTKAVTPNRGWQQTDGSWVNFTGQTPFLRAAFAGDVQVMRLLLAHGADPNLPTNGGTTPLMAAAGINFVVGRTYTHSREETLEAVKLCLEKGADVNARNSLGFTAAHGAANRGLDDVLKLLAEHGANLAAEDNEGRTPMTFAEGIFLAVNPPAPKPETAKLINNLLQLSGSPATRKEQ